MNIKLCLTFSEILLSIAGSFLLLIILYRMLQKISGQVGIEKQNH
jgi:ABC-type transport system involved in Fe-S cluster assembly fused permease/ATPase subunit